MPAPLVATYSVLAKRAAHTALIAELDSPSGGATVRIKNAGDDLLSEVPLTYPCGTVSLSTGALTLTPSGPDVSAGLGGTAAYAELCNASGGVLLALPVVQGASAVPGYLALNTLTIVAGGPVEITAAVIV